MKIQPGNLGRAPQLFLALIGLCTGLFAQSDRGTITGIVSDPSDAAIPAAAVTATNTDTGAEFRTESTATGNFTLPSLPAGPYQLAIESDGFKTYLTSGLRVQVAQTIRVDAAMELGAVTESVTVEAEAALLKTDNAEISDVQNTERLNSLPINVGATGYVRDPVGFIMLSPGVDDSQRPDRAARNRMNGFAGSSYKIIVDGVDASNINSTRLSQRAASSQDAIEEFSLQTSNYSAEFGQSLGGIINFTTKSGTNEYHGTAYEYFVNEALNAYSGFTHERGRSRKHDYGGTFGGPVILPKLYNGRNKTFFFLSLEKFDISNLPSGSFQTLPVSTYRNGDFGAALTGRQLGADTLGRTIMENAVYDPASSRLDPDGNIVRDPFTNNVIPSTRLDPVAMAVTAMIPATDTNDLFQNWTTKEPAGTGQTVFSIKIDHNFNSKARMSFYRNSMRTFQQSGQDGLPIPITGRRDQHLKGPTYRVTFDLTPSPTWLFHFAAGYNRFKNPDSAPDEVLNYDAVSGIGFTGATTDPSGFPRIEGLSNDNFGGMSLNMGPSNANHYFTDKISGTMGVTHIRGRHTIKFGGEYKLDSFADKNSRGAQGRLQFDRSQTGLPAITTGNINLPSGTGVGLNYASFMLGQVNTAFVNLPQDPMWRRNGLGLFLQDNWKATRKLTVDYGLRYDIQSAGHELWYRTSQFSPSVSNPTVDGLLGGTEYDGYGPGRCNCSFTQTYKYAFGPRLGLAYQVNPKTVLRAGWGVFYNTLPNLNWFLNGAILGVGYDQAQFASPAVGEAAVILKDGLQYDRAALGEASLDPGIRPSSPNLVDAPPTRIDRNAGRPARVQQFTFGLQHRLMDDLSIEVAYVGNRGIWLEGNSLQYINSITTQRLSALGLSLDNPEDRMLLTSRIDSPLAAERGFFKPYATFPGSQSVARSLRPFPQFDNNLTTRWAPLGNSWYDSLQVKVNKRTSHGLALTTAFTWAKNLELIGASNNVENRAAQRVPVGDNLILTTGFTYRVPEWRGQRLLSAIFSNWTVGGILTYSSGGYFESPESARSNIGDYLLQTDTFMNRVPGEPLYLVDINCDGCIDPRRDLVLNPNAWEEVEQGQWGASAPVFLDYRQRRVPTEQLSFGRIFPFSESVRLEIRMEIFNAFNRNQLANPSSGNPNATVTRNSAGELTGGFGFINPNSSGNTPRNGQLVARITF